MVADIDGSADAVFGAREHADFTPLAYASYKGNVEAVKALFELTADPNLPSQGFRQQWGPMQWAIYNKDMRILETFRDNGADMSDEAGGAIDDLYNWSPITTARFKYGDAPGLIDVIGEEINPMPYKHDSKTNYDLWSKYLPKLLCDNADRLEGGIYTYQY